MVKGPLRGLIMVLVSHHNVQGNGVYHNTKSLVNQHKWMS